MFDLSKQKPAIASQPIRLEFIFSGMLNVAHYVAYALVLTPKIKSNGSDGQRHFDLLKIINLSRCSLFILKTLTDHFSTLNLLVD